MRREELYHGTPDLRRVACVQAAADPNRLRAGIDGLADGLDGLVVWDEGASLEGPGGLWVAIRVARSRLGRERRVRQ